LFAEITVDVVPVVGLFWEGVGIPAGNIAFNEIHPDLLVFLGEMGRCKFEGMLV
jgi:hypothetical protein